MAAKLLHSLGDDNPDLQKQIGCMAGIFHVFDRQQFLSGKQRRLLPPPSSSSSKFSNGSMDGDAANSYSRNVVKSVSDKCVNEKQSVPRRPTLTSSSSSSSNSSLGTVQPEVSITDRIISPGTHSRDPVISGSPRLSGDIRDVIKDSIHKDSQRLSVQTKTKDHVISHRTLKHIDSPRPLQLSKSVHGKQDVVPTDIKESLRILLKLHDGPWYYNDKELSILSYELKNRSCFSTSRDSPRFSYDGRAKNSKVKDLPRFSLDSRESTAARSSTVDSKFRNLSENEHEQPWASSVVAKLMGLDMLPTKRALNDDPSVVSLRGTDECKSVPVSKSERKSCKGLASPQCKSGDQLRKPSSKFPIEPAPWKNLESRRSSPKQASTQVERLLKDAKERADERNSGSDRNARIKLNHSGTTRASGSKLKESGKSTSLESSIVIMKPAKLLQKSGFPGIQRPQNGKLSAISITTNDQIVRDPDRRTNNRNLRAAQTSSRLLQISKDSNTNSVKNSGSISPRLQRKKLEFDKSCSPPNPPDRRTNNRQSTDQSGSPGGRRRANTCSLRQNDEQLKQKNNKTHMPLKLTVNLETTRRNKQPVEIAYCESYVPAGETSSDAAGDLSIGPEQPSPVSVLDSSAYILEDSLSPVKQTSYAPKDEEVLDQLPSTMDRKKLQSIDNLVQKLRLLNSTQDEPQTDHIASLCKSTNPNDRYISEILVTSGLLLRDLTSSGLSTFQLHPSGHPINPELFFVLEQTKASSFLTKGDTSKPEKLHRKLVFDVVNEILARKLNLVESPPTEPWFKPERLAKKTLSAQMVLKELCLEIELLLQDKNQEFSLEDEGRVKNIVLEDVTHRKDKWMDFRSDLSRVVLDIERSIFKDLVNEIILSLSRRRVNRKLFSS